ncbi:MAG TPA: porin [Holophaga sp.]|jgi:predicted porin|nr:porin [Holophaga sp.]
MRPDRVLSSLLVCLAANLLSAEEPVWQLYGTLLPFIENAKTTGATRPGPSPDSGSASQVPAEAYTGVNLPTRTRLISGTSNLGFKGRFNLKDGLQLLWQVESAISPDGDAPNSWTSRNSGIGIKGAFGTITLGIWDTPYKYPVLSVGALRGLNPFDNALTASPGFNVSGATTQTGRIAGKADAAFSRRQGNSIQYWSPEISGFSARIAYSFNEGRTTETATLPSISPSLLSMLLTYQNHHFGVNLAFEQHSDYFGMAQLGGSPGATLTNKSSKDTGKELVAWMKYGGTKISVVLEQLTYDTDDTVATAIDHYQRNAWYMHAQQRMGDHQVWASYGSAGAGSCDRVDRAPTTTNGLGGRQWAIGYSYGLSKQADLYASAYGMENNPSAQYTAFPPLAAVAPGASTRGFGIGILYTF